MSFGFGNNQQGGSTFGGFGSGGSGGGFGSNTNTTSSGSLFGNNTATSGGFSGFGQNQQQQSNPFAANKPAFGAPATTSSGGGLFGASNTSTSGGFGGGSTGFGAGGGTGGGFGSSTSGGLFGQNKPATSGFGASTTGGSLFGGGNTSTGGFGSGTTASNPFSSGTTTGGTGFGASTTGGGGFGGFGGGSTAGNNNNGTANPPFTAVQEKEPTGSVVNHFQSIAFQDPYKTKSFEELRTEDYAQGRRYGNSNGQAGAFGQSTGFGGFGQQQQQQTTGGGSGLFGQQQSNTATSGSTFGGFGSNQTQNSGGAFGGSTSGGLFGQNKPAGGLFVNNATSSAPASNPFGGSTSGSGGGLFGSNTGGGFGAGTNTSTSGGLFGSNNQQQQSNPFGQSSSNTGGGLFGQQQNKPASGGLFGNSGSNTGGGLFGGSNQQQQSNPFGQSNNSGGGLFGNTQQQNQSKPAFGGFGQSTNTGGAFGSNTGSSGNLFGNTQQQSNTGGGLFGQQQNKPAGGGLFGNSTNTGGGLFGNSQPQQQQNSGGSLFGGGTNQGSSLFGNQNKPAGGSLFGNSGSNTGGMFGNNQQAQNTGGSSLFGNTTNQNQQQSGTSLFGNSNSQQQQPSQLHASLTVAPYGNEQLFATLAAPSPPVGPLATPLNGAKPAPRKTPSLMASMRLNSPVYTPRGGSLGRNSGYGFSYSTYGTPGSAFSTASLTPGASSMLRPTGSFNSALASRLNKSISMGNLRGDGTPNEGRSLLRESALSPPGTGSRLGSGSVRKLNIDHSLRVDLFGRDERQQPPSRRVHYDDSADSPNEMSREREPRASRENALVRTETDETEQEESPAGLLKAPPQPAAAPRQPEMTQVNGNGALSSVPEDSVPRERPGSAPATQKPAPRHAPTQKDGESGEYWTEPPLRQLKNMSRQQLQKQGHFTVGRHGFGRIEFGPCDLSSVDLDRICGEIVVLEARKATVYPDSMKKPAMGQGLNVPSTIYLEQSWARSHGGKKPVSDRNSKEYQKHVTRLKRVGGTNFKDYDPEKGVWVFTVEHFTTYGLDDDDDEDITEDAETSGLSEAPETPEEQQDATMQSVETATGDVDDTFQFKLERRSQMSVPGGFEEQSVSYDYDDPSADEAMDEDTHGDSGIVDPFTSSGGAVQAPSPGAVERYHSSIIEDEPTGDASMQELEEASPEMPGAFAPEPKQLRSILKPTAGFSNAFASPEKLVTESWEEQLQRTISPKKRDRQALKDMQQSLMRAKDSDDAGSPFKQSLLGRSTLSQSAFGESYLAQKSAKKGRLGGSRLGVGNEDLGKSQAFLSRMDLMNSIWGEEKNAKKARTGGNGFEYPYPKKPRLSAADGLDEQDIAFHDSLKPSFSADGTLAYASTGSAPQLSGDIVQSMRPIVGEHTDVRFAKFTSPEGLVSPALDLHMHITQTRGKKNVEVPFAYTVSEELAFRDMAGQAESGMSTAPTQLKKQELAIWRLCSVLFDRLDIACAGTVEQVPQELREQFAGRLRRDAFVDLWSEMVAGSAENGLKRAKSAEEKALLLLTKNDIAGACNVLVAAKDFRLATLVAQLPGSDASRQVMSKQIVAWQKRRDWSEMSDAVRALYSILAGEVCVVAGQTSGGPEDRASEFAIAERFGLNWQQSLALRVCYGGYASLEEAIKAYCEDCKHCHEAVSPTSLWSESVPEKENTIMTLCRLYAFSANGVDLEALFEPLAVSGTSMNSRIAWQLADTLDAKHVASLPAEKMAQLTCDFAAQLESAGKLTQSAWVLLHLQNAEVRSKAISGLLHRNANKVPDPSPDHKTDFDVLTADWKVPRAMVFAAKSVYAKATGDLYAQARYLLAAGRVAEAHDVLCEYVGPQAIIEQEHQGLMALLREFPNIHQTHRDLSPEWSKGGQVYAQVLRVMHTGYGARHGREWEALLASVGKGLQGMEAEEAGKTLEQRVAVMEMKRAVEKIVRDQEDEGKQGEQGVRRELGGSAEAVEMLAAYREKMGLVV